MTEASWKVTTLQEIEPRESWIPVREELGIRAFGINAYRPREDGRIINDHTEEGSGQQEVYIVIDGTATFTLDGEEVEASAGMFVFAPPETKRTATGDATILAIGGTPGEPYQGLIWGAAWPVHRKSFGEYNEQKYAEAAQTVREGLPENPDHPGLLYNYACFTVRAGETSDETFESLRRSIELFPPFRQQAPEDEDFASVKDDPRFTAALGEPAAVS
jgi:hypothetical protein